MSEKKKSPSQSGQAAGRLRPRLSCFTLFFGESVSEAIGVALPAESADKCQLCPDTDICYRISMLRRLDQVAENQQHLLSLLQSLNERWPR